MKIKVQKLYETLPFELKYQSPGASGFDCISTKHELIKPGERVKIPLGFAIEIPEGFEGQVRSRSGLSFREGIMVIPGTIDSDYRGEVCAIVVNIDYHTKSIKEGDRIAQFIIAPVIRAEFDYVRELSKTERQNNGFGSTGV